MASTFAEFFGGVTIASLPSQSDVRDGVTYGDGREGTLIVTGGADLSVNHGLALDRLFAMTTDDNQFTSSALVNVGGGTALTGPIALTVAVADTDSGEPIEATTVRFYRSGQSGTQATNSSGVTVFGLDTATWSWIAEASGYTTRTGTVAVSGDGTLAIALAASQTVVAGQYPGASAGL